MATSHHSLDVSFLGCKMHCRLVDLVLSIDLAHGTQQLLDSSQVALPGSGMERSVVGRVHSGAHPGTSRVADEFLFGEIEEESSIMAESQDLTIN